jgi:hypothetical protein
MASRDVGCIYIEGISVEPGSCLKKVLGSDLKLPCSAKKDYGTTSAWKKPTATTNVSGT